MDGDVGSRIAADDPLGELLPLIDFRLQQRAIAVVDVPQHAVHDVGAQLLVVGVGQLVVDDLGEDARCGAARASSSSSSCRRSTDGFSMRTCLPASKARRAASKWRSSGVATQTASTPWASICATASGPAQLTNGPRRGLAEAFGAGAGAAGDGGQLHLDRAEIAAVKAVGVKALEDGAIGLVEDHAEAGHADAEAARRGGIDGVH